MEGGDRVKRKIVLIAALVLSLIAVGATIAMVFQTRQISNNVEIAGTYDFQVYMDIDRTTVWTSEAWGTLNRSSSKTIQRFGSNIGSDPIYVTWSVSGLSTGLTLTMGYAGAMGWINWAQGASVLVSVDSMIDTIPWSFTVTLTVASDAPVGASSFDIIFSGLDTA